MARAPAPNLNDDGFMATSDPVVLDGAGLRGLVDELRARGYRVVGPTVGENAIVLAELDSADDLHTAGGRRRARDLPVAPARRCGRLRPLRRPAIVEAVPAPAAPAADVDTGPDGADAEPEAEPRYAFLGCAPATWRPWGAGPRAVRGAHPDSSYAGRRGRRSWSPSTAPNPAGCASAPRWGPGRPCGAGHSAAFDLALTERADGADVSYLARPAARPAELLSVLPSRPAAPADTAAAAEGRRRGRRSDGPNGRCPRWTCANCWSTPRVTALGRGRQPVSDPRQLHHGLSHLLLHLQPRRHRLTGEHAERWMGGHRASSWTSRSSTRAVRRSGPSRYRHWLTHKLSTWRPVRQFGLRGLRAVHRLVPDRDRHHRGDGHLRPAGRGVPDRR